MSFVGGKLKLKGGVDPASLKGGVKKKKKSKKECGGDALAVVPADGGEGGDAQAQVCVRVVQGVAGTRGPCGLPRDAQRAG